MAQKSDPQIGVSVDTGDRVIGAGCKDNASKYALPLVDADGHLQIDVLTGGGGGTQYADGDAVPTPTTGTVALGTDGTNLQALKTDSSGELQIDVLSSALPSGASTAAKQPALGTAGTASSDVITVQGIASMTALKVDGSAVTQPVSYATTGSGNATGALRVELPTNGTGVVGLNAGTNAIGKLAANSGVDIGDVDVTSISAGTNLVADVSLQPRSDSNGLSVGNFTSGDTYTALTNTAQVIKASAGKFYGYYIYNPNSSATYVMIYDIAAASVTVGTSTAKLVFCIPATSAANLEISMGIPFTNAGWSIAAATTGGGASAPSTALEAMVWYK